MESYDATRFCDVLLSMPVSNQYKAALSEINLQVKGGEAVGVSLGGGGNTQTHLAQSVGDDVNRAIMRLAGSATSALRRAGTY